MWETMGSVLLRSAQSGSPPPKGGGGGGPSSSQGREKKKKKVVIYDVATIYGRKGVGWTYGRGFWTPRRFVVGTPG